MARVITNIEDLRVLAEKRVPRMFYDYADSGSWTEGTYRANEDDFARIKLRQRVAVNMENRSLKSTDRIDFSHDDACRLGAQRLCRALAHIAVTGDDCNLAGEHYVGRTIDCIHE